MSPKVLKDDDESISVEMVNISVKAIAIFGLLIPPLTLIMSTAIAYCLHSEMIFNNTYCPQNQNYVFISISVLASHFPEKLIADFCVLIYTMSRPFYSFAYAYFFYYCGARQKYGVWYARLCRALAVESVLELFASYIVICVGIEEHFALHMLGFVCYAIFQLLGMFTNIFLHGASRLKTKQRTFYIKLAIWLFWCLVCCGLAGSYPFYIFQCKPWAYPLFTIFEYTSMILITLFNSCIYFDLADFKLQMIARWPHQEHQRKLLLA